MDSADCVDFLHLCSRDPLQTTVLVESVAVGVGVVVVVVVVVGDDDDDDDDGGDDAAAAAVVVVVVVVVVVAAAAAAAIVAVDHLMIPYGYSKSESCKNHVAYVVCVECVVFSVFLDFPHFVVDLASPDYSR